MDFVRFDNKKLGTGFIIPWIKSLLISSYYQTFKQKWFFSREDKGDFTLVGDNYFIFLTLDILMNHISQVLLGLWYQLSHRLKDKNSVIS